MKTVKSKLRYILIEIAGVGLIILAGLTGWLPGPGGIPLLIAGLGLLSINHEWARRWLMTVKKHGLDLSDKFFNNSPRVKLLIDVLGLLVITLAVFIMLYFTKTIARSAAIWLVIIALGLLLGNRGRLKKIKRKQ
jgi:hypothetical protein